MIVKCPACAEKIEIDAVLLNQWGVCPHCQSFICFSRTEQAVPRSPAAGLPPVDSDSGRLWMKIGLIIAAIGLLGSIIGGLLAAAFEGRTETSSHRSSDSSNSYRSGYSCSDPDRDRARSYIDSLPEGQRSAFYGVGGTSSDRVNLLTNLMESGNLDGAIKLMEEKQP